MKGFPATHAPIQKPWPTQSIDGHVGYQKIHDSQHQCFVAQHTATNTPLFDGPPKDVVIVCDSHLEYLRN